MICLNPDLFKPALISWSWHTTIFFVVLYASAALRLRSFAGLGKNFTFVLAEPDKLVTTGIYRYVQHPSYTGLFLMAAAWLLTFGRLDATPVCVLPAALLQTSIVRGLVLAPPIIFLFLMARVLRMRVIDEEEMMKKAFGKDWVVWHAKTARFIPGVV